MKRKLKAELIKMSTDIITSGDLDNISDLYDRARSLYEKLAVLKFIEEKLNDVEVDVSSNQIAEKFERMASAILTENSSVPESNPHEEDIMIPGMDTLKQMVSEMPNHSQDTKDVFADFLAQPNLMKNDKDIFVPEQKENAPEPATPKSLNDRLNKNTQVGLNDKLAFIKYLFNNNTEDYNRVMSQLNTIDTEERSVSFITNMIKPEYDWTGKEEYEERFMAIITRKFQ